MLRALLTIAVLAGPASPAVAGEGDIRENLAAFFQTRDAEARAALASAIESDPAYDRAHLSRWLHEAPLWKPAADALDGARRRGKALRGTLRCRIDDRYELTIAVRVPTDYAPSKPYPLIYALHGTGSNGPDIIRYIERLLGDRAEAFVIAAPTGYRQVVLHGATPPSTEHRQVLRTIKRALHINDDRVYGLGYSRGGHACWTLAVRCPEQFAALVPIAGTLIVQEYDALWPDFLPAARHTPILACWGKSDTAASDYTSASPQGGIAGLNQKLVRLAKKLDLPVTAFEDPDRGHGGIVPPPAALHELLAHERNPSPREVVRTLRSRHAGDVYWITAERWSGKDLASDDPLKLRFRRGEDPRDPAVQNAALARAIRSRLAELRGTITDNHIDISRRKIRELTVWLHDDLVNFDQPLRLTVSSRERFHDQVKPNLLLCLQQAAATRDFTRLRFAGLHFRSGYAVEPVKPTR